MSIVPSNKYAGQVTPDNPSYPHGQARNVTRPDDPQGTPLDEGWINDIWGFLQALLLRAGLEPNGQADTATDSQYLQGIMGLINERTSAVEAISTRHNYCWAGAFSIWQRGNAITSFPSRRGTADGWTFARGTFASGGRVSQAPGSRGNNAAMRVQRNRSNIETDDLVAVFNMGAEDSSALAGDSITTSLRVRRGPDYSAAANLVNIKIKTSTHPSEQSITRDDGAYSNADATVDSQEIALTTAWQYVTFTTAIPAGVKQVALTLSYTPTGEALTGDYFEFEEVQIETGVKPTRYNAPPQAYATIKAQEQFFKTYDLTVSPGTVNYNGVLSAVAPGKEPRADFVYNVRFPQEMRAQPTVVLYSPQTGDTGKCAQGSSRDVPAVAMLIGTSGFTAFNDGLVPVASKSHYVHATAEAIL